MKRGRWLLEDDRLGRKPLAYARGSEWLLESSGAFGKDFSILGDGRRALVMWEVPWKQGARLGEPRR